MKPKVNGIFDILTITLLSGGGLIILSRIYLYLIWQFPAPDGDEALFAPLSINHCHNGIFENPIFPVDPSGKSRYIWHAVMQPAILAFLNFDCSNTGNFFGLLVIQASTAFLIVYLFKNRIGLAYSFLLSLIVFALQVKQGFRPETLAISICLLAEYFRHVNRPAIWIIPVSLLAWTQPTIFVIYVFFVLAAYDLEQRHAIERKWRGTIMAFATANIILLYLYPFPIADLINGLIIQGKMFSSRNEANLASLFTYFVRSDFFPLLGILFLSAFVIFGFKKPKIYLLFPLIYFYAIKVPPAIYNIVPLFAILILNLIIKEKESFSVLYINGKRDRITFGLFFAVSIFSLIGLTQGTLRDINSILKYGSSSQKAVNAINSMDEQKILFCRVPSFFAVLLPSYKFAASMKPLMNQCSNLNDFTNSVSLVSSSQRNNSEFKECTSTYGTENRSKKGPFDFFFKSDSGYSFYTCKLNVIK